MAYEEVAILTTEEEEETELVIEDESTEESIELTNETDEETLLWVGDETLVFNFDYPSLTNKPSINEVVLVDDKSFEQLGVYTMTNSDLEDLIDWDSV